MCLGQELHVPQRHELALLVRTPALLWILYARVSELAYLLESVWFGGRALRAA